MELKHITGQIEETDKLPDITAMILEKSEELRKLCSDTGRKCLILADAHGRDDGTATSFWSFMSKNFNATPVDSPGPILIPMIEVQKFMCSIDSFVNGISNGQYRVLHVVNSGEERND